MNELQERRKREKEWLDGLKVGDDVMVCYHALHGRRYKPAVIDRMTKTLFIVGECKFRRDGTGQVAGGWLVEPTPERMDELAQTRRRHAAIGSIRSAKLDSYKTLQDMPLERLERIAEACREDTTE